MYSLSIDYLFNRIYDVLLWFKYVWLFVILRTKPEDYLSAHTDRKWDGLRDRGWFDDYLATKDAVVPPSDVHLSLWQRMLEKFGFKLNDSDHDGIPDVSDASPYDPQNLTSSQLKERYQEDYTFTDHLRDIFGIGPKDSDGDGIPDSYEISHGTNPDNADSDKDGILDGQEITLGTDPLNNDTDHDGVIDGRDEAPLDPSVSSIGQDSDGDGVSDRIENILGTNIHKKDSDSDGIPDSMDTYPLDPNNVSQLPMFDVSKATDGIFISVHNPVLSLFVQMLSILIIVVLVILIYSAMRWFLEFVSALDHYDHHFEESEKKKSGLHTISDGPEVEMPAGIHNLPVHTDAPTVPPTPADFMDHPRFAIIQGYMSSESEALWRIGIIEADNMLEEVLKTKGYEGNTVSDLLKGASFKTIQLAWDAHNIRNRIAHDGSDFELTEREAKRAFNLYESVFRELKAIH